ncbi:DUF6223 family protein [Micromonospora sp. NPDC005413]|uniref:DUF6223 family protein n=1 Tax=Micromonospora sp. NPDC005413 TaxID=3154563 RepID=UPI0033A9951C
MSIQHLLAAAVTAPLGAIDLAEPTAAHASQPGAATALVMSSGRLGASVAALLGLVGAVIGGLALARPASRLGTGSGTGRLGAVLALATGLTGMALGGVVVATSDSGIGTGNGRGGAFVALAVGLVGVVLGGLALVRSRRNGRLAA